MEEYFELDDDNDQPPCNTQYNGGLGDTIIIMMPRSKLNDTGGRGTATSGDNYRTLCGICPDSQCRTKLYFPSTQTSVECSSCGQRHDRKCLLNVVEASNSTAAFQSLLQSVVGNLKPERGPDNIKVNGLSNFVCKLLSPILTYYGMDKHTGRAKLLTEMGQGQIFDCSILSDRTFLIEPEHVGIIGYGRDHSGSSSYLEATLNVIRVVNDGEDRLIPIHADGDGHCLVHAVSRALVGRELFWHALRLNLMNHLLDNLDKYKELFQDFVDKEEWRDIIEECDPDYVPSDGEPAGLRNIHVFGLANVLRRPIILLDDLNGMQSSGDYSGVFLPAIWEPDKCRGKDGTLNKPLCIAWSSLGRNHFIPLVGVKGKPCPLLPHGMLQRAWGVNCSLIAKYIQFDERDCCVVAGDKCLQDRYLLRLVSAMEEAFQEKHGVNALLVADVHQFLFKSSGFVGSKPEMVIEQTKTLVQEGRLVRCLTCEALLDFPVAEHTLVKGGCYYNLAVESHKELRPDKIYSFPLTGFVCHYNKEKDVLVPDLNKLSCSICRGTKLRKVKSDGTVQFYNGDRTFTPSGPMAKCPCGFKHFWDGKEYDNLPEKLTVPMEWNGKKVEEEVAWFQFESDPQLNSNVFQIAGDLVQKRFPGEFGSERLVQKVVDTLLNQTALRTSDANQNSANQTCQHAEQKDQQWSAEEPFKIILTGSQKQSIHKEELNKSKTEQAVFQKIVANAPKQQCKKTAEAQEASNKKVNLMRSPQKAGSPANKSILQERSQPLTSLPETAASRVAPATGEKKIRIATTDGTTVNLSLDKDLTYQELKERIEQAFNVPPSRQKLRLGFPPQELKPPSKGEEDQIVPITHGDKIMLEILPESDTQHKASGHKAEAQWGSFDQMEYMSTADALLEKLKEAEHVGDSLDASITNLAIIATLAGKDLWTYVQKEPHLFSVGGMFYQQVQRDLGLNAGKHCTLPSLPGKVFRYNDKEDRLELCLEPHGHFAVQPDIERKVLGDGLSTPPAHSTSAPSSAISFGTSGALHSKSSTQGQGLHAAFSGQGHTLRSSLVEQTRMPTDIPMMSGNKHEVRKLTSFCDPRHRQESIEEESEWSTEKESTSTDTSAGGPETKYVRKGPGFSVLEPQVAAQVGTEDAFSRLVQQIEATIGSVQEEEDLQELKQDAVEEDKSADIPELSSQAAFKKDDVTVEDMDTA